jgi:benzoylformate decarboxylase
VWATEFIVPNNSQLMAGGLNLLAPSTVRRALEDHDLILAFGGALFSTLTHADEPLLSANQQLVEFHVDDWELGKNQSATLLIKGDLKQAIKQLRTAVEAAALDESDDRAMRRDAIADRHATALRKQLKRRRERVKSHLSSGAMDPLDMIEEVALVMKMEDVLFDEAITVSGVLRSVVPRTVPGTYFLARGGGLGQGMPGPLGVKLAQPERRVLAIVGDGSAMYTIQSLWTAARYGIAVGWVIAANGRYHILDRNLAHHLGEPVREPAFDLVPPAIDFVALARGLGVAATAATSREELGDALLRWTTLSEPFLIHALLVDPLDEDIVSPVGFTAQRG